MAKPLGLLLARGFRIEFPAFVLASRLVVGTGGLIVGAAWVGLLPMEMPLWLRAWGGAAVAFAVLYFVTRTFRPPTPTVRKAACPRCMEALHYAGFECVNCGVLSFSFEGAADDLEA